jgi:hypothetical protein
MNEATAEQNKQLSRDEHLVPDREIHMKEMRGYRFCEIGLITGTSRENAVANIWNTTGAYDPTPEQFAALDDDAIAKESEALKTWLNPVRHWMFDEFDVWEVGDDRRFGEITATWMGVVGAEEMMKATVGGSYFAGYIYRNNAFTFNEGSEVYLLDAPDGEVFVMQSFTSHFDEALTEDNLAELGTRLTLPDGWKFRSEVLDRELKVSTADEPHMAHVLQDDLHNTYQGSDGGKAFSFVP